MEPQASAGGLDVPKMRKSLGLGAFLYGFLDSRAAADLAGLPPGSFEVDLGRLGVGPANTAGQPGPKSLSSRS